MRIISDFHDYYDISLSYGIDPKCIYNRKTELIPFPGEEQSFERIIRDEDIKWLVRRTCNWKEVNQNLHSYLILFCGKAYFCIEFRCEYYYDADSILNAIDNSNIKDLKKYYSKALSKQSYRHWRGGGTLSSREVLYEIYRTIDKLNETNKVRDILRELNVPILIIENHDPRHMYGYKNPILRTYQFQKAVDPFTAFQEIEIFMSSVLPIPENSTVDVSDQSKLEGHGFDKRSFRHPFK